MPITVTTGGPISEDSPTPGTHAWLVAAIADNMARSDMAAYASDFITMAENWLNYGSENISGLRCREMELTVSLTPTDGACTIPSDYLEYRRVAETTSTRRPLTYITADMADTLYPTRAAGLAEHFTIVGSSLVTFPSSANDIELVYYQAIPPLTETDDTNWLLTKSPSLYLRASLVQAYDFIKNNEEMAKQAALASALIAGLNRTDVIGRYARAGLTMRGVTP